MSSVSIIIVSYNTKELLSNCLSSLKDFMITHKNSEVFVVDNDSKDGSSEMVKKHFPAVHLISNKKNLGFGRANNQAIKMIGSRYIFLLNPDALLQANSLDHLISFIERGKEIGIVGPKLLNSDGSVQREMTPFPRLLDSIFVLLRLHRIKPFQNIVYPDYDYGKIREADHLMGSALLISRKVFKSVGVFDEKFFLWFEETDLQKRAIEAGWKIVYYPKAVVKHVGGQSSRQVNPFKKQTIWNKSLWRYFKNHHNVLERLVLIPFMVLSYAPALFVYLSKKYT